MDSTQFGNQGSLLLADKRTATAQVLLETGALLGGITGKYCSDLASSLRHNLRFATRADRPHPPGVEPADVLLWYTEALRRGGTRPDMVRQAAAFAVAWWNESVDLDWHAKMLTLGAPPAALWCMTIASAVVAEQPEIAEYALGAMQSTMPSNPRLAGLQQLVAAGSVTPATLNTLDDDTLQDLLLACEEHGLVEKLATVATAILTRNPSDGATREIYAATLEAALLGSPGAPDLGSFHPTGAGRALLAMAEAMTDDPDFRWLRRRCYAALKGGEPPETTTRRLADAGAELMRQSDSLLLTMAEAWLTRSQRYQPARHLLDFAVSRGSLEDPRLWRMHAFMTLLQGERMHGHASLLEARRADPAPVQLAEASKLRDTWFPDANLFGDCFDADMSAPIGEAIGHLLNLDYDQAMEVAVDGLTTAHGRAMPELELHILLGECHARPGKVSPRALKNYRRAMERLGGLRAAMEQPGDRIGAERLARSVAASALEVAAAAGLPGEALWFMQEQKLQSLCDHYDGAGAVPPEFADTYAADLGTAFQPDGSPQMLFHALATRPLRAEEDVDFDEPWSVNVESALHAHRMAGRQQGMTAAAFAVEPSTLDALRSRLSEGDVFVEYALTPLAAFAVVATSGDAHVIRIPLDRSLGPACRDAWVCASTPPEVPADFEVSRDCAPLRLLWSSLVQPILPWLDGAQRLIVAADGALHRVPMGILHDGHQYLIEMMEVVQVPTAAVYVNLEVGRGPWQLEAAVLSNPDGSYDAAHGGEALAALCPNNQTYNGQPMTADDGLGLLANSALVHFSAPGWIDPDFPAHSPYAVGNGPLDGQGLLTPAALLSTEARPVLLVVDGQSAEPGRMGTDGAALHPCAGWQAGGISNVVASAWRSDPGITGELYTTFYDALRELSVPSAMAEAQRALLARPDCKHPYWWGAPVCSGEGSASVNALREHGVI